MREAVKCPKCNWHPCICDRLFGPDDPKECEVIEGVAYSCPADDTNKYKYQFHCSDGFIASNSLAKLKEVVKVRKMSHAFIDRNDGGYWVSSIQGHQMLVKTYEYTPRY